MAAKRKNRRVTLLRVLIIIVAALLVFALFSMAASVVIFSFLFPRSDTPGVTELVYSDIDRANYPRREIPFKSSGSTLYGYLYGESLYEKKGLVILVSGIGSGADRHLGEIMFFVDHGLCAFAYDGTGIGKSEGAGMKGLPQFRIDLLSAIDALRSDPGLKDLPIFLYGHSAGGYAVTTVLSQREGIAAAVSISGFDSPNETMLYHAKKYTGILADIEYPFLCLQNFFVFGKDSALTASAVLNKVDTPVLIVEGAEDTVVPAAIGIARYAERISDPNVTYLLVDEPERSGHSTIWLSREAAKYHNALVNSEKIDPETLDKVRINEPNAEFLQTVLRFYLAAIENK